MSCKTYGWRGHKYLSGECACGLSLKDKLDSKVIDESRIQDLIYEATGLRYSLKKFTLPILLILFTLVIAVKIIPTIQKVLLNVNNTSAVPTQILPSWLFVLIPAIIIISIVNKFFRNNY